MAYQRITLTQLKERLAERLGGEQKFWNEPEREAAINEAIGLWQLLTGDVVQTDTQVLPPDTNLLQLVLDKPVLTTLRVRCDPCAMVATVTAATSGGDNTFVFTPTLTYGTPTYDYQWYSSEDIAASWRLDETSGTRTDVVGTFDLAEVGTVATVTGVIGNGVLVDATNYLLGPTSPTPTEAFSLSLWFKTTATSATLLWSPGINLVMVLASRFYAEVDCWETARAAWDATTVNDGNWHHGIVTVDPGVDLYVHTVVDGTITAQSPFALSGTCSTATSTVLIGGAGAVEVDEVNWYSYAISTTEQAALWNSGAGARPASPPASTAETYVKTFAASGTQTATVHVTDSRDCIATASVSVTATAAEPMTAGFTSEGSEGGIAGESWPYTFYETVTGGTAPYSYLWDFGDGISTATGAQPTQIWTQSTWSNPQEFVVTLTVTDDVAATVSTTNTVEVTFNV